MFRASVLAVPARLESHTVDRGIYFGDTDDLLYLLCQRRRLLEIDRLAAEASGLCEALGNHIADDNHGSAEKLA
jgi:hypothetical protein